MRVEIVEDGHKCDECDKQMVYEIELDDQLVYLCSLCMITLFGEIRGVLNLDN